MENELQTFDLTNQTGLNTAIKLLRNYGWIISPATWLIFKILETTFSEDEQVKLASEIIKSGGENGAKRVKIKVSKNVGMKLKNIVELPIDFTLGGDGNMELEVEYK